MNGLELQGDATTTFPEFKCMLLNYYIQLGDKNIAWQVIKTTTIGIYLGVYYLIL